METLKEFFKRPFVKRLCILTLVGIVLFLMHSFLTFFLLMFIFIYLFNSATRFVCKLLRRFMPVNEVLVVVLIYVVFFGLLVLCIGIYTPQAISQFTAITDIIAKFFKSLKDPATISNIYLKDAFEQIKRIDFSKYAENGGKLIISVLSGLGTITLHVSLAFVLSLFFMLEKKPMRSFMTKFEHSNIDWLYVEIKDFGIKFAESFGSVIEAQLITAVINAVFSIIVLWLLHFSNLLGLFVLIFVLGLIPVLGVFVTLVPLAIIAYSIGGIRYVIYVILLTAVLHAFETYIIKPKLMSNKIKLPTFLTLFILIVSEHYFGIWGLIVGIPLAVFLLSIIDVQPGEYKPPQPVRRLQSKLHGNK